MMIKQLARAALAKAVKYTGMDSLQAAGARSTSSTALNYNSVTTLDPSRLASAFFAADQGFINQQAELFELVEEQDPHIFAELAKRRRAVTGLGWQLLPPKDATAAEEARTQELQDMLIAIPRFEKAQYDLTDAIGKGFCALEIDWKTGSQWLPQALNFVPQRMFQTDRITAELKFMQMGLPVPLREWGWVVHEHHAKSGYIEQSALFRVLAWTYAYKAYNIRDMQRFLEVYGMPLRLGKYPGGIGKPQRDELLRAVRNLGNDGAGIVPSTMSIDFIQAQAGKVDDFLNATAYWEQKQSKAILGGELDGKTTSEARIMLYDKVRREIFLHDVRQIEPTLNTQLIRPIALVNGMFAENRLPSFHYDSAESVDQEKMVKVLAEGVAMGMEIDLNYAHTVTQIPRAEAGAQLLVASKPPADSNPADKAKPADAALTRLVALAQQAQDTDVTGIYAAKLAALSAPYEEALTQQIAAIVAESGSFDEALEKIAALSAPPSQGWIEAIAKGMAAANLAGRDDV